jgi:DnaJ homolog subfamily C member 17
MVEARKQRFAKYDSKRKQMLEELEERERAFKKLKVEKDATERERAREADRIRNEGKMMREQREKDIRLREEEAEKAAAAARAELEPPSMGKNIYKFSGMKHLLRVNQAIWIPPSSSSIVSLHILT